MRAILFDIGNVLVAYDHRQTLSAVAAVFGVDPDRLDALYHEIGPAFGRGELTPVQVCTFLNRRLGANISLDHFTTAFCAGLTRHAEALQYAAALQVEGEMQVGAISNTNAVHVAWLDEQAPELAQFDLVIMSNEVSLLKPDPEIFELALEVLDLPATQTLYIDDVAENVVVAQQLGMASFVHIDWADTRRRIDAWRSDTPAGAS
jgi:putative hydrolase of the HAD superfamily